MSENVTTKFKVDISDLKKNIEEANRQVKLYRAELKNASAGMEKGEENADSLTKKIEAQSKIVEAEKAKLQALKDELTRYESNLAKGESTIADLTKKHEEAANAFGKDSEQAKALAKQLKEAQAAQERNAGAAEELRTKIINQDTAVKNAEGQIKRFRTSIDALKTAEQEAAQKAEQAAKAAQEQEKANKSLTNVVKKQESELKQLKEQYVNVASAQGKDSAEAKELADKIAILSGKLNANKSRLKESAEFADKLDLSMKTAAKDSGTFTDKVSKQEKELADLKRKYADVTAEQGKSSAEAKELAGNITALSGELKANRQKLDEAEQSADAFDRSLDDAGKSVDETDDKMKKSSNGGLKAFTVALGNLASQIITKAVSGLGNLVKSVIDTGKAFDTSMSNVKAISGATGVEIEVLTKKAEDLGASSKFTATQVADGFGYMAMAGMNTEEMLSGIDGIMNLAAASGADLAATSDIVTDSLTAFGKSAKYAGQLADIMAAAASNSNTNVQMMGETFKYAAPLAGAMGYSMEDVAIATGLMANSGIKATQAGTSLRSMLTRMSTEPKEAAAAMEKLGVSLDDGQGNMKSLMQIMQELRGSFGNLKMSQQDFTAQMNKLDAALESGEMDEDEFNKAQEELIKQAYGAEGALKAQYASMLAGKNGLSGFLAIVNASEEDFDKLTDSIYNSEDAAKSMADTMIDNLEGSMTLLSSAFDGFKKNLHDKINEPLRNLIDLAAEKLIPLSNEIGEAFGKWLDDFQAKHGDIAENVGQFIDTVVPEVRNFIGWVNEHGAELLALIGGIAASFAAFKAVTFIQQAITAFQALAAVIEAVGVKQMILNAIMAANPVGLIVAAIAGLVAAFVVLWNKSDKFRNFWIGLWDSIQETLFKFFDNWTAGWEIVKTGWNNFTESLRIGCDMIGEFLVSAWENIKTVWNNVKPYFENKVDQMLLPFRVVKDVLKGDFEGAWEEIKRVFSGSIVGKFFGNIWDSIKEKFTKIGTKIGDAVGGAFKTTINAVLGHIEEKLNSVPNAINGAIELLNGLPGVSISPMDTITLPRLAKGGIINKSTIAQIGENGKEAIIPLERNKAGLREIARLLREEMGNLSVNAPTTNITNAGKTTTINFTQNNSSPKSLSQYELWRQTKNMLNLVKLQGV